MESGPIAKTVDPTLCPISMVLDAEPISAVKPSITCIPFVWRVKTCVPSVIAGPPADRVSD